MQTHLEVLCADHPNAMRVMIDLAKAWHNQLRYKDAEYLQSQVLNLSIQVARLEDSLYMTAMKDLTNSRYLQGQ